MMTKACSNTDNGDINSSKINKSYQYDSIGVPNDGLRGLRLMPLPP